ncbi:hypothetical protein ABZX65_26625 [Streptomyces sp. NPDC003300]|uniref:hypothetical protein n=1 Tax=unclassified Streptomyces TaxID=2593676 RepID=UPI0033AC2796
MPPRKRAETKPDDPATPEDTTDPAADGDSKEPETTPAEPDKSDLQPVGQPCPACFPNGWADGAFAHGCEHGTWVRNNT